MAIHRWKWRRRRDVGRMLYIASDKRSTMNCNTNFIDFHLASLVTALQLTHITCRHILARKPIKNREKEKKKKKWIKIKSLGIWWATAEVHYDINISLGRGSSCLRWTIGHLNPNKPVIIIARLPTTKIVTCYIERPICIPFQCEHIVPVDLYIKQTDGNHRNGASVRLRKRPFSSDCRASYGNGKLVAFIKLRSQHYYWHPHSPSVFSLHWTVQANGP